jgi:hypothetical protein
MKIRTFLDVAPCSLVGVDRRFRGAYVQGAISQKALIFRIVFIFHSLDDCCTSRFKKNILINLGSD